MGPPSTDEEATAYKVATPRLNLLLQVLDTLCTDGFYCEMPNMEVKHNELRAKISELIGHPPPTTTHALSQYVRSLGIKILREGSSHVNKLFVEQDPRNVHDQQASDAPPVGDSNDQNSDDFRNNAQMKQLTTHRCT